ncbi:hypothetical protein E2562_037412 [Oryza meyeriana var. granulata]|uniref:F-box domain-containing protein n=1 Tax=Oryza meyeriana var. granulata TaxID=110450 RepID=A0A6G1EDM9_9ORYZ|nr:hypothetical protein E2562_037412 [Oryza meyeriana var. granulata]
MGGEDGLMGAGGDGDVDTVGGKDVNKVEAVGNNNGGAAVINGGELEQAPILGEPDALDLSLLDGVEELAVVPLRAHEEVGYGGGEGGGLGPGEEGVGEGVGGRGGRLDLGLLGRGGGGGWWRKEGFGRETVMRTREAEEMDRAYQCCSVIAMGHDIPSSFIDLPLISLSIRPSSMASSSSPPVRPWADLQHDLLVVIMSRVGVPDLLSGGATRACSAWRAAARDPLVWRHVDLRDWAALTSARRRLRLAAGDGAAGAAGRGHAPLQAALCSVLEIAARRAAGRIEALLLPEFADEEHLLFLAQR